MNMLVAMQCEKNLEALLLLGKNLNPCNDCVDMEYCKEECYAYEIWWKSIKELQNNVDDLMKNRIEQ